MATFRVVPVVDEGAPGWAVEMAEDTGETVVASVRFDSRREAEVEAVRLSEIEGATRSVPLV